MGFLQTEDGVSEIGGCRRLRGRAMLDGGVLLRKEGRYRKWQILGGNGQITASFSFRILAWTSDVCLDGRWRLVDYRGKERSMPQMAHFTKFTMLGKLQFSPTVLVAILPTVPF